MKSCTDTTALHGFDGTSTCSVYNPGDLQLFLIMSRLPMIIYKKTLLSYSNNDEPEIQSYGQSVSQSISYSDNQPSSQSTSQSLRHLDRQFVRQSVY